MIRRLAFALFPLGLIPLGCSSSSSAGAASAGDDAGSVLAPSLASLAIAELPLTPAFSPTIHDYYVRCTVGTNTLTVSATAAAGSTVSIVKPLEEAVSSDGVAIAVDEGGAIVARASANGVAASYWVRCLPHDFPTLTLTPHPEVGTPTAGYYLIGDITHGSGEAGYAMALDPNGVPVWYHRSTTGDGVANVSLLLPNVISFAPFVFTSLGQTTAGAYELHELDPWTTSFVSGSGTSIGIDVHELRRLDNGNFVFLIDQLKTNVDLSGLSSYGAQETILDEAIQEVEPGGNLVWQWVLSDHFDPVQDTTFAQTQAVNGNTVIDPFHCNAIDVATNGDLLVSCRHMDSIFLITRATGAIAWKMGGSSYTKEGAPYLKVDDPFYRQHDARLQADGTISLFDDETAMTNPARGVVYSIDTTALTATLQKKVVGPGPTTAMGSFRLASDGTSVIGWGEPTGTNLTFSEFDANGNDVLDFVFGGADWSYRAIKIDLDALDLDTMRNTTGLP